MPRLIPVLLSACTLHEGGFAAKELVPPVPVEPGDGAHLVYEGHLAAPFVRTEHADATGLWVLMWNGDGYGPDLRFQTGPGLVLLHQPTDLGQAPTTHPPPPLPDPAVRLASIRYLPVTTPGHLAFHDDTTLYRYDGTGWTTEPFEGVASATCLGVGPARSVWIGTDARVTVVEDGATRSFTALPDQASTGPIGWGPFDGDRMRPIWTLDGQVCTGLLDLRTDTLTPEGCLDLGVPVALQRHVGGAVDRTFTVVSTIPPQRDRFVLVDATASGVSALGVIVDPPLELPDPVVDDPQTDFYVLRPPNPAASYPHTELILPDGSWTWTRDPTNPVILPASTCPCVEQDPTVCWCVPRTLSTTVSGLTGPHDRWLTASEWHDEVRYVWAAKWTDPDVSTTADPTFATRPYVEDEFVMGVQPGVLAPGWPDYADLGDCLSVTDATGAPILPDADGRYVLPPFAPYTVRYEGCDPGDGGPPLLPIAGSAPGTDTGPLDLYGASLGRGWPLDPADDPPVWVSSPVGGAVVRETTGWTHLAHDDRSITRTTLDAVDAAAPHPLHDGRWLLADGRIVVAATGTVDATIPRLPGAHDVSQRGSLLIQDGDMGLRVHDLATSPPTVHVDEPGARTATLLDLADDASVLLETDDATVWVRRPTGLPVSLGTVGFGLRRAAIAGDGRVVALTVRTSSTSVQERRLSLFALHGDPLVAEEQIVREAGYVDFALHRPSGAVLGARTTGNGLAVHTVVGDPAVDPTWSVASTDVTTAYVEAFQPFASPSGRTTDAAGWAWFREGQDVVGYDFTTGTVSRQPLPDLSNPADHLDHLGWLERDAGTGSRAWYRLDGGIVRSHGATDPVPLAGNRAARLGLNPAELSVGDAAPGEPLVDPVQITRFPPVLAAEHDGIDHVQPPCALYALEPQPAWVTEAPTWACVR